MIKIEHIWKESGLVFVAAFLLLLTTTALHSCGEDPVTTNIEPQFVDTEIFDGHLRSCLHFLISVNNSSWNEFLIITGNTHELMPDTELYSYDLSTTENADLFIDQYHFEDGTDKIGCLPYCNDVVCSDVDLSKDRWEAIEGTIFLQRSDIEKEDPQINNHYTIDITVRDVVFMVEGNRVEVEKIEFEGAGAGRFPG